MKLLITVLFILGLFLGCGSGAKEASIEDENSTIEQTQSELIEPVEMGEENITEVVESNHTIMEPVVVEENLSIVEEENQTLVTAEVNYTDEELTLEAYSEYITYGARENNPQMLSLLFKGALPLIESRAVVQANQPFDFEVTWQNPEYTKNVSFYFFNGYQRSIQYLSLATLEESSFQKISCQSEGNYSYSCARNKVNDSKYYEDKIMPVNSSFVVALCDRDTRDPQRICDFVRIPIVFVE